MDKKNVKKLIEYITKEPTEDEHKRGHKYPFMSAEILNAEISKILDFFLIPDAEFEMKDKILKNIDNELSFSDEFPEVKSRVPAEAHKPELESEQAKTGEENQSKPESDEFVDVVEEDSEKKESENDQKNNESEAEKAPAAEETDNTEKTQGAEVQNKVEEDEKNNKDADKEQISNVNGENNDKENAAEQAAKPEEQSSDRIELLEFLLEFIESEGELNYVLAGYFSKFFIALLNRNSGAVKHFFYNIDEKLQKTFFSV